MGYMASKAGFFVRHAFFVDIEGKAADPTILLTRTDREELEQMRYISFQIFRIELYLKALEANHYEPALYAICHKEEEKAYEWAKGNNCVFLG